MVESTLGNFINVGGAGNSQAITTVKGRSSYVVLKAEFPSLTVQQEDWRSDLCVGTIILSSDKLLRELILLI